jgi:CheY-like chemotaxis protein
LTHFEAAPDLVDLVITDLNMPGLSGKDLIEAIRGETPDKPILVITGNPEPLMETDPLVAQAQAILHKPIRIEQLAHAVHDLLP